MILTPNLAALRRDEIWWKTSYCFVSRARESHSSSNNIMLNISMCQYCYIISGWCNPDSTVFQGGYTRCTAILWGFHWDVAAMATISGWLQSIEDSIRPICIIGKDCSRLHYDGLTKFTNIVHLSLGLSYNNEKFPICHDNFNQLKLVGVTTWSIKMTKTFKDAHLFISTTTANLPWFPESWTTKVVKLLWFDQGLTQSNSNCTQVKLWLKNVSEWYGVFQLNHPSWSIHDQWLETSTNHSPTFPNCRGTLGAFRM